jgi:hypothetical protein
MGELDMDERMKRERNVQMSEIAVIYLMFSA